MKLSTVISIMNCLFFNLWYFISIFSYALTVEASLEEAKKCDPGYVLDLNDNCVKKFVLPKRKKCPDPDQVPFGGYQLELGGRMVKYWCENGWKIFPASSEVIFCKMGQWDLTEKHNAFPSCVRAGCEELQSTAEVKVTYQMDGAAAKFECVLGDSYHIVGNVVLTCDGQFWNSTAPVVCEKSGAKLPISGASTHHGNAYHSLFLLICVPTILQMLL